jgi:hypothetical protein
MGGPVTLRTPRRAMQHRHLNHQDFTLAAVDDIIRRGDWRDWVQLRRAAHRDAAVLARIERICGPAACHPPQEGAPTTQLLEEVCPATRCPRGMTCSPPPRGSRRCCPRPCWWAARRPQCMRAIAFRRMRIMCLGDLRTQFDLILAELESVAGWRTARVNRPVLIWAVWTASRTGIRQLIRDEPLETREISVAGQRLRLPTEAEMLRIKAVLVLKRNATRDYVDLAALTHHLGLEAAVEALRPFGPPVSPAGGGFSLAAARHPARTPQPYDLEGTRLSEYKGLDARWHEWSAVESVTADLSAAIPRLHPGRRVRRGLMPHPRHRSHQPRRPARGRGAAPAGRG